MPATLTTTQWVLMLIAAFIVGFSKSGFSGAGILAIPLAAMVLPARESTGIILPMLIVGDIMAVAFYRRHAIWKYVLKLLPYAITGIFLGYALMGIKNPHQPDKPLIDNHILKPIIGIVILALLILNTWRNRRLAKAGELHVPESLWFAITMGVLAGIVTMMANAAGPIIILYLLAMKLPKTAFIGTGAWYFLILNTFKIPFSMQLHLITPASLLFNLELTPVIILGGFAGVWLIKFVPEKPFTLLVQFLAAIAALHLILSLWTDFPLNLLPQPPQTSPAQSEPAPTH